MENRKIKVTYPDDSGHVLTEQELREKWKEEVPEWVNSFIRLMETQGYAYTRFGGKYEFIDEKSD
jgi:hypothetical protein